MKFHLFLAMLILCNDTLLASNEQNKSVQEKIKYQGRLKLGETFSKTIKPDAIDTWTLMLAKGQYAVVEAWEKSTNIAIRVINPTGRLKIAFNNPLEIWGKERATWIAETDGLWKVEIAPIEVFLPGEYEIKWTSLRQMTKRERQMSEADSLVNSGRSCYAQGKHDEAERLYRRSLEALEKTL